MYYIIYFDIKKNFVGFFFKDVMKQTGRGALAALSDLIIILAFQFHSYTKSYRVKWKMILVLKIQNL